MEKIYNIEVDCANCANKMQETAKGIEGIKDANVNFMALKMKVAFEDDVTDDAPIMKQVLKACRKFEPDCEIDF